MRLRDRMGVAWRVVTGQALKGVVTTSSVEGWSNIRPNYSEVNFETMVRQGWRKNELIYACIHKAANTAAQVALKVMGTDGTVMVDHPMRRLIQKPNKFMSEYDFWYSVIAYQKLGGRAAFEKVRSRSGQVVELWPLRPDWLSVKATGAKISGYEYGEPGAKKPVSLKAEDVLDFRLWDPLNQFHSWPPVAVAARIGDVDNEVTDYVKNFFEKGGVPPLVLSSKQQLLDDQVTSIRARWKERYGGHENWTEPAVLDSEATVQVVGLNFEEMGFGVVDARNESRICMVLDVPPILVGAKVGLDRATYSNYVEAERSWWQDSLTPLYANFVDVLENQLAYEWGVDAYGMPLVRTGWDFTNVWVFQEERNQKWTRAASALGSGGITVNEYRKEIGLGEVDGGDVFLRPMNMTMTGAKGEQVGDGGRTTEDGEEEEEMEEGEKADHEIHEIHEKGQERLDHELYERGEKVGRAPDEEGRRKSERRMAREMEEFLGEQLARIERELRKRKDLRVEEISGAVLSDGLRLVGETKAEVGQEFWEEEDRKLSRLLRRLLQAMYLAGAEWSLGQLVERGIGLDWALVNEAALRWSREYGYKLAGMINQVSRDVLVQELGAWIESGAELSDLVEALAPTFGGTRAEVIAVTETTRAYAEGNLGAWRESGVVSGKRWNTANDELVCEICGPLDGMEAGLDENGFTTEAGGMGLTAPPAHPNCRCWMTPVAGGV